MAKLVNDAVLANPLRQDDLFDDFNGLDTVAIWTDVSGDSGAAPSLASDGESAVILTTGATDNNECYLTSKRTFDVTADSPIVCEGRLKYTEANTDDANLVFGLMSGAGANSLLDNGGGPAASYSGAVLYKVDGSGDWVAESSVGSSQTTTTTDFDANAVTTYQNLRIEIMPVSSTEAEVTYFVGQSGGTHYQQCKDSSGLPIKHTITYTSFAAANFVIGVKAGSANSETPRFDYVRVSQVK